MGQEKIEIITPPSNLGESLHWDEKKQVMYYVDMYESLVHCYNPSTNEDCCAKVGPKPTTFIIPVEGYVNKFVIGYGGSLEIITWDGKSPTVQDKLPYLELEPYPAVRLNDAKCTPSGVLFVGSMSENVGNNLGPPNMGNVFIIDTKTNPPTAKKVIEKISLSNGFAWNRDENIMYWCETVDRKVYQFDYDRENLILSNKKVLIDFVNEGVKGTPDGMCIDTDDHLWIACVWDGEQVVKVDTKTGKVLHQISLSPVKNITTTAFGGPNLADLYITSIKGQEQHSGACFRVTGLGCKGYPGVSAKLKI